jgi:hypothetical protein
MLIIKHIQIKSQNKNRILLLRDGLKIYEWLPTPLPPRKFSSNSNKLETVVRVPESHQEITVKVDEQQNH